MNKHDYEAKINREKKENEKRKNLLILILRYIVNMGYAEAAFKLQEEANLNLDKFDAADNIDLYMILCEYEEYFELRFNKKPKLITKINEGVADIMNKLPGIRKKESRIGGMKSGVINGNGGNEKGNNGSANGMTPSSNIRGKKIQIDSNGGNAGNNSNFNLNNNKREESDLKLELVGKQIIPIGKKPNNTTDKDKDTFTFDDQKESILLKPIPDNFFGNNEMKELAGLVRR